MAKSKILITFSGILVACLGLVSLVSAQPQPISDAQINRIKENCESAKNILSQVQTSDALLRVNRGQLYEYMTTKLMAKFNTRAGNNNLNNKSLVAVKDYYDGTLDTFRNDYQSYAEQLDSAIKIDCLAKPAEFYQAVINAREKRQQVHNDVVRLNQNLQEYRSALSAFNINFNKSKEAN